MARLSRFKIVSLAGVFVLGLFAVPLPQPYVFPTLPYFPSMPVASGNPPTIAGVELGRYLFYDTALSLDSTVSCSSCHKQEHAFSDLEVRFSQGFHGAPQERNTPGLFNLAWYNGMFWDGRAASIEDQIFEPVRNHHEMNLSWMVVESRLRSSTMYPPMFEKAFGEMPIDSHLVSYALAQFLRTLISHQSKYDRVLSGETYFTDDEYQGFVIVNDQSMGNCLPCHTTDAHGLGTNGGFANNGLQESKSTTFDPGLYNVTKNPKDAGRFKIPSLRNLKFTAPYMHDGRFATIREVIDFYSEGVINQPTIDNKMAHASTGGMAFTETEKMQILAFLQTLNDSVFVSDPRFSNPFEP